MFRKSCLAAAPFFILVNIARAQCPNALVLGSDTTLCEGGTLLLNAGPGYQSYLWDNGSTAQTRLVSSAGTYSCTTTDFSTSGELVVNGNFSAGSAGFNSSYGPGTGGAWGLLSNPGTFAVANNPNATHVNFASFGDHTTGIGAMMVVNGADVPGLNVWCQTVAVQPNSDYAFSAWLASCVTASPAQLVFTINGITIGNPLLAPGFTGQWVNFYSLWNSGSATSATICIANQNTNQGGNDFALDDISFAPFCTYTDQVIVSYQAFPEPDLGPDITACDGTPIVLTINWPDADAYAWQNGSPSNSFPPQSSGTYWVDVTENGCTARDSIEVLFTVQPTVDLGADQVRCEGESQVISAFFPNADYLWNDGSTASNYTVSGTGTYSVVVDVAGCADTDSVDFLFHPLPIADLGPDTLICADTVLVLDAERPGGSYLWDNNSTSAQRTVMQEGIYWVAVTELGCTTRDTMALGTIALPEVDLGPDFLLCKGTTRELRAHGPGYHYLWSTGDTVPEITVDEAGLYAVTVANVCDFATDSITISLDQCDCPVHVPNAFTPNGDDKNEGWRPRFECEHDQYLLQVFNRWGELIWQSESADEAWNGDAAPDGVYAWRMRFRPNTVEERVKRVLIGHVVVLR